MATNLWQEHFVMYELQTVMRQKDKDFAETLNRIREGNQTPQDISMISSCTINEDHQPNESDSIHLFISNELVEQYNQQAFDRANTQKVSVRAKDTIVGSVSDNLRQSILDHLPTDPKKTMQLYTTLQLATDLRYDASINVRIEDGITNGASCIIKKLCISRNNPTGIGWVEFND